MRNDPRIENRIADVLAGSGLPVDRRSEIAEELRGHLEQLVESKRGSGLVDQAAVEAALNDFGPPEVVRRQLRRQHGIHERHQALAGVRRFLPALIAVSMFLAAYIAIATSSALLAWRIVATAVIFASVLLAMCPIVHAVCLATLRAKQQLPRQEFRFVANASYWFVRVIVCLGVSEIILGAGAIFMLASLKKGMPQIIHITNFGQLSLDCGRGLILRAGPRMALLSMVVGLIVAGYRWRRCAVDTPESTAQQR